MMNVADGFSATYAEARAKFRKVVTDHGGQIESMTHPEPGPDGGDLTTDAAWFGPRNAEKVLVMLSATHGVEGFCGSGAQIDWLIRGEGARAPRDVAILMIHAVNPYGFAWLRRVTNENVDLNRNWIDFGGPLPSNPGYDELADAICPADWSEAGQAAAGQALGAFVGKNGPAAFQQALSGGQYAHPKGIFYGGAGPTWSRKTQTALYEAYLKTAGKIAIIDYHTGLGPWGHGEQIVTVPRNSPDFSRAVSWYGGAITSPSDGSSTSAPIVGDGLSAAAALLPHAQITGMALEYGVLPLDKTLKALRADAWLHAHGDLDSPLGKTIKKDVRDSFYGDADDWKGMIAGQSLLACRQAIAGLGR